MTDFWWLTTKQKQEYTCIELVHHEPLTKDDDSPYKAFRNPCFTTIENMKGWCDSFDNTNVFRELTIWSDKSKRHRKAGPVVLDIDNDNENLNDALLITRNTVKIIKKTYHIQSSQLRIFFTGHKGFNIEINPEAIGIRDDLKNRAEVFRRDIMRALQTETGLGGGYSVQFEDDRAIIRDRITGKRLSSRNLWKKTLNLVSENGTIIDGIHDFVRLHDSINEWISQEGEIARRKIELDINELNQVTIEQIVEKSALT